MNDYTGASTPTIAALRTPTGGRLVLAVVVAATALGVGWFALRWTAGTPPASTRATTVSGLVVIEGGPPPPPGSTAADGARPDPHARIVVTGTTDAGGQVVRRSTADAYGRFALHLPPGAYTLAAVVDGGAPLGDQPHTRITVTRGHPVRARITIHAF